MPAEIAPGRVDVVIPIIHGTTGEDGALQGFLETLGIPYVGAGVAGSAIGMDKSLFKAVMRDAGIPTPRTAVADSVQDADRARGELERAGVRLPVFVKPSNGGSSVGVAKVKRWEDLAAAIASALRYDERALVEEGIDARELECAVLGDEDVRATVPGEIVPGHEFYDYDDKYRNDKAKLVIPADVRASSRGGGPGALDPGVPGLPSFGNGAGRFFLGEGDRTASRERGEHACRDSRRSPCIRSCGRRAVCRCRLSSTSWSGWLSRDMRVARIS